MTEDRATQTSRFGSRGRISHDSSYFYASRMYAGMAEEDDSDVVTRCLEGDVDAFSVLVGRYERVVYNLALRMLGHPEDARDAAQTAFLRAWESLERFDRGRRFFSWIYRITMNECLNQIERRRRFEPVEGDVPASDDPGDRALI